MGSETQCQFLRVIRIHLFFPHRNGIFFLNGISLFFFKEQTFRKISQIRANPHGTFLNNLFSMFTDTVPQRTIPLLLYHDLQFFIG